MWRQEEAGEGGRWGRGNYIRIKRDFMSPHALRAQCFSEKYGRINYESFLFTPLPVHLPSLASHIQFILKPCQSYLQDRSRICQLRFRLIVCVVPSSVRFCVPTSLLSGRSGWWPFSDCHFAIRSGMRLTGSGRARAFGYKVRPSSTFFCYSSRGSRLLP